MSLAVGLFVMVATGVYFLLVGFRSFKFVAVAVSSITLAGLGISIALIMNDPVDGAAEGLEAFGTSVGTLLGGCVGGAMIGGIVAGFIRPLRNLAGGFSLGFSVTAILIFMFMPSFVEDGYLELIRDDQPGSLLSFLTICTVGGVIFAFLAFFKDAPTIIVLTSIMGATGIVTGFGIIESSSLNADLLEFDQIETIDLGVISLSLNEIDPQNLNPETVGSISIELNQYIIAWFAILAAGIGWQYMTNRTEVDYQLGILSRNNDNRSREPQYEQQPSYQQAPQQQTYQPSPKQEYQAPPRQNYEPQNRPQQPSYPPQFQQPPQNPPQSGAGYPPLAQSRSAQTYQPTPSTPITGDVLILSRGHDTGHVVNRLLKSLKLHFPNVTFINGPGQLLAPGDNYMEMVPRQARRMEAVLVLVGNAWLKDEWLANASDRDTLALQSALSYGIPVTPIFVNYAIMPSALPTEFSRLQQQSGLPLNEASFEDNVTEIGKLLEQQLRQG